MSDRFAAAAAASRSNAEADALMAELITMGVTRAYVAGGAPVREVRLEHPDLPGMLIIPAQDTADNTVIKDRIIDTLASALAEERTTPHGD